MPLTSAGREALEAIHRESSAFEARYASTPYKKIPVAELVAQRRRDCEAYALTRSQAIASGDGELFQLLSQDCNTVEAKRRDQLYWDKYGLRPAPCMERAA